MADVAPSDPPTSATVVEELRSGRYAVTKTLGGGGQGETLEAVDKRDGRLVAVKRFRIKGAESWKDVELAEREARVLSSLDHPSLPRYIEHFEESGALYLVMEKIEGETLRELSRRQGSDQQQVIRLLNDVADVLDYLHRRTPPLIHRDIKPSNIIRRPDGAFALVDFGSVRDCLKPEGGSTVVGTFGYMAPEQFQGRALPASDIYGLGATALALLTGMDPEKLPHHGLAIDVERAIGGQVDVRLLRVLKAMLVPDPDVRATQLSALLTRERLRMGPSDREHSTGASFSQSTRSRGRSWSERPRATPGSRVFDLPESSWLFKHALVVPLVLLALEIAKLATWALFEVMLPVLFGLLSIFLGRPMRRAAVRIDYAGKLGRENMTRLGQHLTEQADRVAAQRHQRRHQRKLRVEAHRRRRIAPEESHEHDEWHTEQRRRRHRR